MCTTCLNKHRIVYGSDTETGRLEIACPDCEDGQYRVKTVICVNDDPREDQDYTGNE
jgi:hypothetical protein